MLVVIQMLSCRIFCAWSYVTFGPVSVRNWGRERWWYANSPKISDRRNRTKTRFSSLVWFCCCVGLDNKIEIQSQGEKCRVSHRGAGMAVQQGISGLRMEVSWVHAVCQMADTPLPWMEFSLVTALQWFLERLSVPCWDAVACTFSDCLIFSNAT